MSDFSSPYTAIDYGKDFNYFNKLSVNSAIDGYFPTNCNILIPFPTYSVTFNLESGGPIQYSFNGITCHGDMTDGYASENLSFVNRPICKVWFRGVGTVRIEAWGIR